MLLLSLLREIYGARLMYKCNSVEMFKLYDEHWTNIMIINNDSTTKTNQTQQIEQPVKNVDIIFMQIWK